MKFDLIVSDPPWPFKDKLTMSKVPRGAHSNYKILDVAAIKTLKVAEIVADDAVLALWVPSSLMQEGLDTMRSWGFRQTQTHIWVKVKKSPFQGLLKAAKKSLESDLSPAQFTKWLTTALESFELSNILNFKMGRLFRQTHELCLIGIRGKIYSKLENKSQRSVHFDSDRKHSSKPDALQQCLERMFPQAKKLEMFARRPRAGWTCIGLESPDTLGEDIRDSIVRLARRP